MARRRNRSTGVIGKLDEPLKDAVEQMLLAGETYRGIVEFLQQNDVTLSQMAVCRYARKYLATVEQLKLSQENMRMMMEEMDKYPDLDTTEAILRVASSNVFNAISSVPQEGWEDANPMKLLKEATGLIRAAGYKRRVDMQNKTGREAALDANQSLLFDVLAKKHPELYGQVVAAINAEKELAQEDNI